MSGWSAAEQAKARGQAVLTIDLAALADNWRLLAQRARGAECAAVVKADAYGLGIAPVAKVLRAAGCETFFVAHLYEGEILRALAPDARIYILNGLASGSAPAYIRADLIPVLGSLPEIAEWAEFCGGVGARHCAAIHVDTGMNRLGLPLGEVPKVNAYLSQFNPVLVMSHFVSAEDMSAPRNHRQIERFEEALGQLPPIPASMCNSSGLFLPDSPFFDLARPGYALYGGNPTPGAENPMRRVVGLEALILQVRDIAAGDTAGYNAIWTAPTRRKLATVNIGYADGFLRSSSGGVVGVEVFAGGHYCPVVGRISMDLTIIDISEAGPLARGDSVEILGENVSIDELATQAGTIGYEILTDLGRRYERIYLGGVEENHAVKPAEAGQTG